MRGQGPSYRLDIAPAPQTTDDRADDKQLSDTDTEGDENDDQMQKNKTTNTETDTWKSQVEISVARETYTAAVQI